MKLSKLSPSWVEMIENDFCDLKWTWVHRVWWRDMKQKQTWHSIHNPTLSVLVKTTSIVCLVHITIFVSAIKTQIFPPLYSCSRYWAGVATDNGWVHDNLYTMAQSIVLVITEVAAAPAPSLETSLAKFILRSWDSLHSAGTSSAQWTMRSWLSQFYLHQVKGVVWSDTSLLSQLLLHCALRVMKS